MVFLKIIKLFYFIVIFVNFFNYRCDVDIDECENNPCQNGGICQDLVADFQCICTEEYIGRTCSELKINNCDSNKCENSIRCIDIYSKLHLFFYNILIFDFI